MLTWKRLVSVLVGPRIIHLVCADVLRKLDIKDANCEYRDDLIVDNKWSLAGCVALSQIRSELLGEQATSGSVRGTPKNWLSSGTHGR